MNQVEITRRIEHYRSLERQWADSLYELDQHATYRLLAAGDMAGVTGERANELMSSAPLLWGWSGDLRRALDSIEAAVAQGAGVFGTSNKDAVSMLTEPIIDLGHFDVPETTPRYLLDDLVPDPVDPGAFSVTIDTLISLYRSLYAPVRDVIAEVDAVWRDLMPRISAGDVSLAKAEATCARLDARLPEVRAARQRLDAVKSSVSDDPLGLATTVGDTLDSLVAKAAEKAGSLERAYGSVDADAEATAAILAELRVLRARAGAAYSEAEAKISPATQLLRVPSTAVIDGANGLAHRAAQIGGADRPWKERRAELDHWHETASRLRDQLQRALDVNRSSIDDRNELRGLLQAYRAKADMLPDLPQEVTALGDEAHHELFTAPTDLVRARQLIEDFSGRLRNYGGGS